MTMWDSKGRGRRAQGRMWNNWNKRHICTFFLEKGSPTVGRKRRKNPRLRKNEGGGGMAKASRCDEDMKEYIHAMYVNNVR